MTSGGKKKSQGAEGLTENTGFESWKQLSPARVGGGLKDSTS